MANIDVKDIQTLKSLSNPPALCAEVGKAVLIMRGEKKNYDWRNF